MIVFDSSTGKFRDSKTGRLRSDVSGLLSSNARRQYKEFVGNIDVAEYRRKLGQKSYRKSDLVVTRKTIVKQKPKVQRDVFKESDISDFDDYIDNWEEDFDFVLQEDDTDLETP